MPRQAFSWKLRPRCHERLRCRALSRNDDVPAPRAEQHWPTLPPNAIRNAGEDDAEQEQEFKSPRPSQLTFRSP